MQTGVVVLVSGAAGVMSAVLGFIAEAKRLMVVSVIYILLAPRVLHGSSLQEQ
jgi:hypothetical protein